MIEPGPQPARLLLLGGYGVFGARAAERLAGEAGFEIIVAGRDPAAAERLARQLARPGGARFESTALDAFAVTAEHLRALRAGIVMNFAGPYQAHDYRVARAAIAAGAHYIDLADARPFVTGITALDAQARAAGVLVVAGASSVPALAAAVIDSLLSRFAELRAITYGISPGNSFDPGAATVASIIGGAGQPFPTLRDGRMHTVHGWQPLVRHRFRDPEIGARWLGPCDIPDLDIFPARYPTLQSQRFLAGVEVGLFQAGLWGLSWLVRSGLVQRPQRLAAPLLAAKRRLRFLGSDRGVMFATLEGLGRHDRETSLTWELVAREGHGPYLPATPAVILARRLASGDLSARGAMPCVGLITLDEITREIADLDIRQTLA